MILENLNLKAVKYFTFKKIIFTSLIFFCNDGSRHKHWHLMKNSLLNYLALNLAAERAWSMLVLVLLLDLTNP